MRMALWSHWLPLEIASIFLSIAAFFFLSQGFHWGSVILVLLYSLMAGGFAWMRWDAAALADKLKASKGKRGMVPIEAIELIVTTSMPNGWFHSDDPKKYVDDLKYKLCYSPGWGTSACILGVFAASFWFALHTQFNTEFGKDVKWHPAWVQESLESVLHPDGGLQ